MKDSTIAPLPPLRVCFFGTYRDSYVRNEVMITGLREAGAEVYECHSPLWHSVADRVEQAGGGWRKPAFWWRVIKAYWRLWRLHGKMPAYDILWVGYPGQFDVYLGSLLSKWRGKPMVLDILMSLHLIAEERGLTKKSPLTGKLIFWLEKGGLHLPDLLIADTPEYHEYYVEKYNLGSQQFTLIPLGVDDRLYQPRPHIAPPDDVFKVIYYGTFIPLHSVPTMIKAAALLQEHPDIQFDFYGEGQEFAAAEQLAGELGLTNLTFHGWVDKTLLPDKIAAAHVVLGVFGNTKQSRCTIQNKIWEGMMMQRPVITGDAETLRLELAHGEHVCMVERENAEALAEGILALKNSPDLRAKLSQQGHQRAQANTIQAIGQMAFKAIR